MTNFSDDAAAGLLGVPEMRLRILRSLRERPATVGDVIADTGWSRNGVQRHLDALEQLGCVRWETTRIPGSDRPVRRYIIEPEGVERLAWQVFEALAGT